ncbi:MAG: hypothetical protein QXL82_02925 [Candidatus Aenigmatarchaeota archaeon]
MKAISTFIATIILVLLAVGIGVMIYMWAGGYFKFTTQETGSQIQTFTECQKSSIRIDPSEIRYDFSKVPATIDVIVRNIGSTSLHNFTFTIETSVAKYEGRPQNQRTPQNPLEPGEVERFIITYNTNVVGKLRYLTITAYCNDMKLEWKYPLD